MTQRKRVVVVGGGPGGLCAAMLLSARQFAVTVLEKRARVGGRTGRLELGPYVFDVGSTMLMMPFVLEEMFALAGRRLRDELPLQRVDPMYRLDFGSSGRKLDVYADADRMAAELCRFSAGSEQALARFLREEHARLQKLYPVLQRSYPSLASLLDPRVLAALPHIGLGRSLHATMREYFDDEALQLGFSFQAAYLGMSPWECPGGFGMVPYVEHAWGIEHIRGGVHQLCDAFARVASSLGAEVRTDAPVRKLRLTGGKCVGVELESGECIDADDVIINADATAALQQLLDTDLSFRFRRRQLKAVDESCSTFMLYLGLDCELPLRHHTFFFAEDYRREMKRLFELGALDDDLSLYVCNPSATDPSMAPPGHSALYVLALVPNTRAAIEWGAHKSSMRTRVLRALEQRVGTAIEPHIRAESALCPKDWEDEYNVSHGAVFGPAHRIGQLLAFRLPNRLPTLRNVFLTGGGTSPGSGLPTIFESARIAARSLCEDHGVPFPAPRPLPEPSTYLTGSAVRAAEPAELAGHPPTPAR